MSQTTVPPPAATANGNGAHEATFPVDSFRDAAPFLRRPFTVQAVKFKPQSVTRSGKTLCVAYIDARLVVERLNMIVPHLWHDEYEALGAKHLICRLTVDKITRQDIGEGAGKALYSDALKRAAVKFGIGVSLYAIPAMFLNGKVEYLNEGSSELHELKARYDLWLQSGGIRAFGEPLDHGDADEGQGDVEASPPPVPAGVNPTTGEVQPTVDDEQADRLVIKLKALVDAKVWTGQSVKLNLAAAGATDTSSVKAAVSTLAVKQATQLEGHVDTLLAPAPA